MKKLKLIAKLARAKQLAMQKEYAVLLDAAWDPIAIGVHSPDSDDGATTAIVNVLQSHSRSGQACLATYAATSMCTGMAHNLSVAPLSLKDDLAKGDELGADDLPEEADDPGEFLRQATLLRGAAGNVVKAFTQAPTYATRRVLSANLYRALSCVPEELPFRGMPGGLLEDTFMFLTCSLVGLTWSDVNIHGALSRAEKLCGNNVGAVIVKNNRIIAWGLNCGAEHVTFHAETLAIQSYLRRTGKKQLPSGCVIYTSLQPCHMCAGLIQQTCPEARTVYALKDGGLRTCLQGKEKLWVHELGETLKDAIEEKKNLEEEKYSSIHYLRGSIGKIFLGAFKELQKIQPSTEALADLCMHCMELLLIAAKGGMATGHGIEILAAAIGSIEQLEGNRLERLEYQLDKVATEQRDLAEKFGKDAKHELEKAQELLKKAKEKLKIVQKGKDDASGAADGAANACSEAESQQRARDARDKAEAAEKQLRKADIAVVDATKAWEDLKKLVAQAQLCGEEAKSCALQSSKAASAAKQAAEELGRPHPAVGSADHWLKKSKTSIEEAEKCGAELQETLKLAKLLLDQAEVERRRAESETQRAQLAVQRLSRVAELRNDESKTSKQAASALQESIQANAHAEEAEALVRKAETAVAECHSLKAKTIAQQALDEARKSAEQARKKAKKAAAAAKLAASELEKMKSAISGAAKASSQKSLDELIQQARANAENVGSALNRARDKASGAASALKTVETQGALAISPITCRTCSAALREETTEKTRWHACSRCGNYYCNVCGAGRTRSGYFSHTRVCECGATTELI